MKSMIGTLNGRSVASSVSSVWARGIRSPLIAGWPVDSHVEEVALCQSFFEHVRMCRSTLKRKSFRPARTTSPAGTCGKSVSPAPGTRETSSSATRPHATSSRQGSLELFHRASDGPRNRVVDEGGNCEANETCVKGGRRTLHACRSDDRGARRISGGGVALGSVCKGNGCTRILESTGNRQWGEAMPSRFREQKRRLSSSLSCCREQGGWETMESHVEISGVGSMQEMEMEKKKKRIVFLGTPEVAADVLLTLLKASEEEGSLFEVVGVVTQPPNSRGRGRKRGALLPCPVAEVAFDHELPPRAILSPASAYDEAFLADMSDLSPDLCITAAYGNMLPKKFLSIPRFGTLNIHPSLLPLYRGAAPVQRTLEHGAAVTGVSVAFTVRAMDAGPVLAQEEVQVDDEVKAPELLADLFARGTALLLRALPSVLNGDALSSARKQDHSRMTTAAKVRPEEGELSFEQDPWCLHNKVRAFASWPGTKAVFRMEGSAASTSGSELIVVKIITTRCKRPERGDERSGLPLCSNRAEEERSKAEEREREVVFERDALRVECGNGSILEILEVQPPGKRSMKVRDFWNGLQGRRLFTSTEAPPPLSRLA